MSNLLSGRKKLNKLTYKRFNFPREDEFEISAGENTEGDAIIISKTGRNRNLLKPTVNNSVLTYNDENGIRFEEPEGKPQFIYFMEYTFNDLVEGELNIIKKIAANVGSIDSIDKHYVFVGDNHSPNQTINVYLDIFDESSGNYTLNFDDKSSPIFTKTIEEGASSDKVYELDFNSDDWGNQIPVKDRDRIIVTIETTDNVTQTPLKYAHVVLKMRINTGDLTSPWARSIFQHFLEQPYSQLLSNTNQTKVLDYLEKQVIYNTFRDSYQDSRFLFAYSYNLNDTVEEHFRISPINNKDRTWVINGKDEVFSNVPNDKLNSSQNPDENFVIITQKEEGNVFDELIHMEDGYTGILPVLWAKRVIKAFIGKNPHLSEVGPSSRISEWKQEGLDYSKTWSDDGNTVTGWRFQYLKTPNMISNEDQEIESKWSDTDENVRVNSEGYLKSDVNDSNITNPKRMWGNNTPEIDKLFHRFIGSTKYVKYYDQYDRYNYVSDEIEAKENGSFVPVLGDIPIKTSEEIRTYYWNNFGFGSNGDGRIDEKWFYPIWGGDNSSYGNIGGDSSRIGFKSDINKLIDDGNFEVRIVGDIRYDNEGYLLSENINFGLFFPGRGSNINNRETEVLPDSYNGFLYYYKNDKLCIITEKNKNNIEIGVGYDTPSAQISGITALKKPFIYSKNYIQIQIRLGYNDLFPFPVLRGFFNIKLRGFIASENWFNYQDTLDITEADIYLGDFVLDNFYLNLPIEIQNTTSNIGVSSAVVNDTLTYLPIYFKDSPNIEKVMYVGSDLLRIIEDQKTMQKLKKIGIARILNYHGNDGKDADTFVFDIDNNDMAINIHAHNLDTLEMYNCNLSEYQVDAIIKAFKNAVELNLNTQNILLRLDNYRSQSDGQNYNSEVPNKPPSINNLDLNDNVVVNSDLDYLISSPNVTIIYRLRSENFPNEID